MSEIQIRFTDHAREEVSTVFDLLSNRRRLRVVTHLSFRAVDSIDLDDLIDVVYATEINANRESVAISLVHVHLPKLEHAGLIDFDHEGESVHWLGSSFGIEIDRI
jgi:DNA-binding transcriptional ArsR family regulator